MPPKNTNEDKSWTNLSDALTEKKWKEMEVCDYNYFGTIIDDL